MIPRKIVLRQTKHGWLICQEIPGEHRVRYRTLEGPYHRHEYALERFDFITGGRDQRPQQPTKGA